MFYHIFPCRSVFLLELTLSFGVRGREEREWCRKRVYLLTVLFGAFFVFFFCGLHSCLLSLLSFSFSPPPPPPPLSLFFFREGKRLLSSRLELLSSAYLAILLSSPHHHYHHHQSSWVSWKRLCKSHIPPSLPFPCLTSPLRFKEKK